MWVQMPQLDPRVLGRDLHTTRLPSALRLCSQAFTSARNCWTVAIRRSRHWRARLVAHQLDTGVQQLFGGSKAVAGQVFQALALVGG
jgi:hypothetical protein